MNNKNIPAMSCEPKTKKAIVLDGKDVGWQKSACLVDLMQYWKYFAP